MRSNPSSDPVRPRRPAAAVKEQSRRRGGVQPGWRPSDLAGVDAVINAPVRLGLLTALLVEGTLDYTALRERLEVPDGSLHLHLGKLANRGLVAGAESSDGQRPRTTYRLTLAGKAALSAHFGAMRSWLAAVEKRLPKSATRANRVKKGGFERP